jgi:hypothetical protein
MDAQFIASISVSVLGSGLSAYYGHQQVKLARLQVQSLKQSKAKPPASGGILVGVKKWPMIVTLVGALSAWIPYYMERHYDRFDPTAPLKVISDHRYYDEVVPLDGFDYENCDFENVSFKYNGTTKIIFNHNHVGGSVNFRSDVKSISSAIGLIGTFAHFRVNDGKTGQPMNNNNTYAK